MGDFQFSKGELSQLHKLLGQNSQTSKFLDAVAARIKWERKALLGDAAYTPNFRFRLAEQLAPVLRATARELGQIESELADLVLTFYDLRHSSPPKLNPDQLRDELTRYAQALVAMQRQQNPETHIQPEPGRREFLNFLVSTYRDIYGRLPAHSSNSRFNQAAMILAEKAGFKKIADLKRELRSAKRTAGLRPIQP